MAIAKSMSSSKLLVLGLALACFLSSRNVVDCIGDPDEVLDFCVAVLGTEMGRVWQTGTEDGGWMGGSDPSKMGVAISFNETTDSDFVCKDPVAVTDFVFSGLAKAQAVNKKIGSLVTKASVFEFPAVNTLQISSARVDFVKNGLNPPHVHPRATEILFVLEGSLLVGFVDTNNNLFQQTLQKGDLFVFPKGLIHFEMETGQGEAHALANFDSQNPGTLLDVAALLSSTPPFPSQVIETAFGINEQVLDQLISGFSHLM